MKMSEFLALSDDKKEELLSGHEGDDEPYSFLEDKGKCSQCEGVADPGDFCWGCHKLICPKCFEEEPHLSECVRKPL